SSRRAGRSRRTRSPLAAARSSAQGMEAANEAQEARRPRIPEPTRLVHGPPQAQVLAAVRDARETAHRRPRTARSFQLARVTALCAFMLDRRGAQSQDRADVRGEPAYDPRHSALWHLSSRRSSSNISSFQAFAWFFNENTCKLGHYALHWRHDATSGTQKASPAGAGLSPPGSGALVECRRSAPPSARRGRYPHEAARWSLLISQEDRFRQSAPARRETR